MKAAFPSAAPEEIPDVVVPGRSTREWALHSSECPLLRSRGIDSLGASKTGPGYRVWRRNPSFSNIHLTISGRGEAWIGGRWEPIVPGMAILSPRGVGHGSRALARKPWEFCWIGFAERPGALRRVGVAAPAIVRLDTQPLIWAVLSFEREFRDRRRMPLLETLLNVVMLHVEPLAASPCDDPLWKLWERVAREPALAWDAPRLARLAGVSERHLLRICRGRLGRSLREQVTHLRMTRAAALLQSVPLTLEAIAESVGYRDAFTFSKAFKKWTGVAPSRYRLH